MRKNKKQLTSIEQDILSEIKSGGGLQKALAPLVKRVMEVALEAELENHLEENSDVKNYRNGKSVKTVKSSVGEFELETPRDRNCDFDIIIENLYFYLLFLTRIINNCTTSHVYGNIW